MKKVVFVATGVVSGLMAAAASAQTLGINEGRLLASNCMQCHGTNGQPRSGGATSLVGTTYSKFKQQLADLANKNPASDPQKELMIVHAKTYSAAEIDAIAHYLSGQ